MKAYKGPHKYKECISTLAYQSKEQSKYIEKLMTEIIENECHRIVNLDVHDLKNMFLENGEIKGIEVCVPSDAPNRMSTLIEQVQSDENFDPTCNHVALQLFYPSNNPITMEELSPLSDWMDKFSEKESDFKWGLSKEDNSNLLRAIVLLQDSYTYHT